MNKKKLLALLMALVMTLTLVPVTAFAEGEATENSVAKVTVGDTVTYYDSLQDAIDAAFSGGTVELIKNVTIDKWDQNLWAKIPGQTVYTSATEIYKRQPTEGPNDLTIIGNYHTLTIENVYETTGNGKSILANATNLTVKNLTVNVTSGNGFGLHSGLIENVTFNMNNGRAIYTEGSIINDENVGHIEIRGCTFYSTQSGAYAIYSHDEGDDSGMIISNNTFNTDRSVILRNNMQFLRNVVNGAKGVTVATDSTARVEGNYFTTGNTSRSIDIYPAPQAVITGNIILGNIELENEEYSTAQDLSGNYWKDGVAPTPVEGTTSDSYYNTANIYDSRHDDGTLFALSNLVSTSTAVAKIGTTEYETLEAAITAAKDGDTVKLLANVSVDAIVEITKSITLDGDNHTLTTTATRGIWIDSSDVDVTIENMEIVSSNNKMERSIQVNTDCDNVTLNLNNITTEASYYTVNVCGSVDNLKLNINGCTLTGWGAVNLWGNNGTVTISGSTLAGINDKGYNADGWNDFGTVVVEGDTTGQTDTHASAYNISISDTTISASQTTGNQQFALLYNNPSVNNAITLTGCSISLGSNCSFLCNQSNDGVDYSTTKIKNTFVSGTNDTLPVLPAGYTYVDVADEYKQVALHYVAQVGNTQYTTLEAAVAAAPSGGTVTLIDDIDYSTVYTERNARDYDREHAIDLGNLTLDMDNHSISTINATVVFGGNGATITNGTFVLVPKNTDGSYKDGSYALIIDNAVNDHGASGTVLVKDVVCNGGINLCSADVTLDNVTASTTPTKFYAVWAEQNAKVTILGGTYTLNTDGNGVLATGTGDEGGAKIYVTGGNYNDGNKLVYKNSASDSIQITGGKFYTNPSAYVADGYEAVAKESTFDNIDYHYVVGKITTTSLTPTGDVTDISTTYAAQKTVVDENDAPLTTADTTISVTVTANQIEDTNQATAKISNITAEALRDVVGNAADKAGDANVQTANVEITVAKSDATPAENTITYEVHPEAIITVSNSDESTTVALTNDQIQGTFTFNLNVAALNAEQVTVVHKHANGTSENMGTFVVDSDKNITLTVSSFSEFDISAATVDSSKTHFDFKGIGLRRRVLTNDGTTVVRSTTDIRFGYELIDYSASNTYYFQWKKDGGEWSNPIEITNFNSNHTEAALVINKVPSSAFGTTIYTRIFMVDGNGNTHVLDGEGKSVDGAIEAITDPDNGFADKWVNYAKFLKGDISQYSISDY